jgi:hypothetical protein
MQESGVDLDGINGLHDIFEDVADPFAALDTSHLQEKYYHEQLGLIVS